MFSEMKSVSQHRKETGEEAYGSSDLSMKRSRLSEAHVERGAGDEVGKR